MRWFVAIALSALVGGCGSLIYDRAKPGLMLNRLTAIWVGPDTFLYVPLPQHELRFASSSLQSSLAPGPLIITPGIMYTDGGSIPRVARIFPSLSPWRYGPAYLVHDWIFLARRCANAKHNWSIFREENNIKNFDDTALILAEAIKTLGVRRVDGEIEIPSDTLADNLITRAVDSSIAYSLWESTDCNRVSPYHVATVWRTYFPTYDKVPPEEWKLTSDEIIEAKKCLNDVNPLISPDARGVTPTAVTFQRLTGTRGADGFVRTPNGCRLE